MRPSGQLLHLHRPIFLSKIPFFIHALFGLLMRNHPSHCYPYAHLHGNSPPIFHNLLGYFRQYSQQSLLGRNHLPNYNLFGSYSWSSHQDYQYCKEEIIQDHSIQEGTSNLWLYNNTRTLQSQHLYHRPGGLRIYGSGCSFCPASYSLEAILSKDEGQTSSVYW